jgi:hypothetical protein
MEEILPKEIIDIIYQYKGSDIPILIKRSKFEFGEMLINFTNQDIYYCLGGYGEVRLCYMIKIKDIIIDPNPFLEHIDENLFFYNYINFLIYLERKNEKLFT